MNMNMKKLMATLLCLALTCAMIGCDGSHDGKTSNQVLEAHIENGELHISQLVRDLGWSPEADDADYGAASADGQTRVWLRNNQGHFNVMKMVLGDGRYILACWDGDESATEMLGVSEAYGVVVPYELAHLFTETLMRVNEDGAEQAYGQLEQMTETDGTIHAGWGS